MTSPGLGGGDFQTMNMTADGGGKGDFAEDDVIFYNIFGLIFASFTTKFGSK